MNHTQKADPMKKRDLLMKLLLIVAITLGSSTFTILPKVEAANSVTTLSAVKITDKTQAIERAKQLKLLPEEEAKIEVIKYTKPIESWQIGYTVEDPTNKLVINERGFISLSAATGELLHFSEEVVVGDEACPEPCTIDSPKLPLSKATVAATKFFKSHQWKIDADWKLSDDPISEYELYRHGTGPFVKFDRTHNGIIYPSNNITISLNGWTGKVAKYYTHWSKVDFVNPKTKISASEAGRILFNAIKPTLVNHESLKEPGKFKLIYTTQGSYKLNANGKFFKGHEPINPPPPAKVKAKYPAEYAKHRLLALYDLELYYLDTTPNKAELAYRLQLKAGVPLYYQEPHPYIDAQTGEWLNFLHEPLPVKLPPASDWLIDLAAAPKDIDYKAAVVWNNELAELKNTPINSKGVILVPFREIVGKFGAKVTWEPAKKKLTATKGDVKVAITIGSKTAYINGKAHTLSAPPQTTSGVTYAPAKVIAEAFGATVNWNAESKLVLIKTDPKLPALTKQQLAQLRLQAQLRFEEKHWK
ncbi:copper amine oxidase N-terminal domain-containing protein [Paenibacillus sp. GSMTC-2017]|nr:copper amine oxidase N-terminal domain-containing protein [Paenibacillus sp. GSMTC-2017]